MIAKNTVFKLIGALLIILSVIIIIVYDGKIVKWIIVSISAALGLILLYMARPKHTLSDVAELQSKLRSLLFTKRLKIIKSNGTKVKLATGGVDTEEMQDIQFIDDKHDISTPKSNILPEKESSMKELIGEDIDDATLNARKVLSKYIALLDDHDFNNPDNFSKRLCQNIVDRSSAIVKTAGADDTNTEIVNTLDDIVNAIDSTTSDTIDTTSIVEKKPRDKRPKLSEEFMDYNVDLFVNSTIDEHAKPLIYTRTDILIPTTMVNKSNWTTNDLKFDQNILSSNVPFIYRASMIRAKSYVYNNYIDSLHLERHLKSLHNSDELIDYDWFVRMDKYVQSLSKREIFTLSAYTFIGDVYANNYMRGSLNTNLVIADICDPEKWESKMFPLFYQMLDILSNMDISMCGKYFAILMCREMQYQLNL